MVLSGENRLEILQRMANKFPNSDFDFKPREHLFEDPQSGSQFGNLKFGLVKSALWVQVGSMFGRVRVD